MQLAGGIRIRIDKKQLTIVSTENKGKIVDVFAGKEYLFTATVNEEGDILLAKNSSIAQECSSVTTRARRSGCGRYERDGMTSNSGLEAYSERT
jgi:predicted PilT family ATPase